MVIDPDNGRIVHANMAACSFYGHELSQLQSMNISDIAQLSQEEIREIMKKAVDGEQRRFILTHRMASGENCSVEVLLALIAVGGRTLMLAVVRDITDRQRAEDTLRRAHQELESRVQERTAAYERANRLLRSEILERRLAEQALRDSEERFRQVAENVREAFWVATPDSRIIYANPAFQQTWYCSQRAKPGDPLAWLEAVHAGDRTTVSKTR